MTSENIPKIICVHMAESYKQFLKGLPKPLALHEYLGWYHLA